MTLMIAHLCHLMNSHLAALGELIRQILGRVILAAGSSGAAGPEGPRLEFGGPEAGPEGRSETGVWGV